MLRHSAEMSKQKAFFALSAFLSGEKSVDEEILNEQLMQLQTQNLMLAKQIGKILRAINTNAPVKLCLDGLIQKNLTALDFILSGIKGNTCVRELDLTGNGLESDDLQKICEKLEGDTLITKLRLGQNAFTDALPLLELIQANGGTYTHLNISQIPFDN